LDVRSTQAPPQLVCPGPHLSVHCEPLQTWVAVQVVVQEPQCEGSAVVSTQAGLQKVPLAQTHCEATQLAAPQLRPQAPQLAWSLSRSTQAPLQVVLPVGQPHWPDEHCWSALQALAQVPQCCGSFVRSTQLRPQAVYGVRH